MSAALHAVDLVLQIERRPFYDEFQKAVIALEETSLSTIDGIELLTLIVTLQRNSLVSSELTEVGVYRKTTGGAQQRTRVLKDTPSAGSHKEVKLHVVAIPKHVDTVDVRLKTG